MTPAALPHSAEEVTLDGGNANHPSKVAVIGTGYVGLPLCVLMKKCGHHVTAFDLNEQRVTSHREGKSTIDDVEDSDLEGITFTNDPVDMENHDVYIVCVPTPVTEDSKTPNLKFIESAKETLQAHAKPGSLIILESTVGVGDTRCVFKDMSDAGFHVANSPERIDPSRKEPTLQDIPKVVGGLNSESTMAAFLFYDTIFTSVVPVRNSEHSEAVKLLENSYRAVNIGFVNEFADFCESSELDVKDIVDAASTKPYGFSPFRSWIGVGGHCIPVDPHYLMHQSDLPWPILSNVMNSVHERPIKLARELCDQAENNNDVSLGRVLVCGVSYKPNVADTRDAPQDAFCRTLIEHGVTVDYFDPLVESFMGLHRVLELSSNIDLYDKVLVMHQHQVCKKELEKLRGRDNVKFYC